MTLAQAFEEGGWGMYVTLVLGSLALALAIRHALKPKNELMPLIVGIGLATLFSGTGALFTGFIATIRHTRDVPPGEQLALVLTGVGESLHNVTLALTMAMLIALVTSVGSYRARLR